MRSYSTLGFAIAATLSPLLISDREKNKTLAERKDSFLSMIEKYYPEIFTVIENEYSKGEFVEEITEIRDRNTDLVISRNKFKLWVSGHIDYHLIIPKMEDASKNNPKINQAIQDLALSVNDAKSDFNLSNSLYDIGSYYRSFRGNRDNGFEVAEDLYIKSLKLIDVQKINRHEHIEHALFYLAEMYLRQGKNEQAKDFYNGFILYNKKLHLASYVNEAREKIVLLEGSRKPKHLFKQRVVRILVALLLIIFFPLVLKVLNSLPIIPIVIILIVIGATFNSEIVKWSATIPLLRVKMLMKKWNMK